MHLWYRSKEHSCDLMRLLSFELERSLVLEQFPSSRLFAIFWYIPCPRTISDWCQSAMADARTDFCILALFLHAHHLPVVEGRGSSSAAPWWKQASAMAAWAHSQRPRHGLCEDCMLETLIAFPSFSETLCIQNVWAVMHVYLAVHASYWELPSKRTRCTCTSYCGS